VDLTIIGIGITDIGDRKEARSILRAFLISISRSEEGSTSVLHRDPEVFLALSLESFLRLLETRHPRGNLVAFRR
jgi:hypothetical protein